MSIALYQPKIGYIKLLIFYLKSIMKNLFTSFRRLLMTSALCLGAVLVVQSKEVEVTASAHLSDLLSEEDLQILKELIVTTNGADLTVADFDIINEMSSVKIVDLSSAI